MKRLTLKLKIILSLFFLSLSALAQVQTVRGVGRFYTRDDDSISFINAQLRASAYRDVLTKEFKSLGLDSENFWHHYEVKFEEYFANVKEELMKKYNVTQESSSSLSADYKKALRHKRLSLKARYGRIGRAIKKEKVLKQSRSPQVPNSRYMKLEVGVDRKEIFKIYLQFTNEQSDKHYSSLYISTEFQLVDTSWSELGVELQSDFTEVLKNNWRDQIAKSLEGKIDSLSFADSSQQEELKNFSSFASRSGRAMENSSVQREEGENLSEENYAQLSKDYGNSLWLRLSFKIKKVKENIDSQRRDFTLSGDLILQDLKSQKYIYFKDFDEVPKSYSYEGEEKRNMSNALANTVYQMPLSSFRDFQRSVVSAKTLFKRVTLEIVHYTNAADIFRLIEKLSQRGVTKQFNPSVKSLGLKRAQIELEYSGEDNEMIKLLRSFSGSMIAKDTKVLFSNPDGPFEISLIRLQEGKSSSREKKKFLKAKRS